MNSCFDQALEWSRAFLLVLLLAFYSNGVNAVEVSTSHRRSLETAKNWEEFSKEGPECFAARGQLKVPGLIRGSSILLCWFPREVKIKNPYLTGTGKSRRYPIDLALIVNDPGGRYFILWVARTHSLPKVTYNGLTSWQLDYGAILSEVPLEFSRPLVSARHEGDERDDASGVQRSNFPGFSNFSNLMMNSFLNYELCVGNNPKTSVSRFRFHLDSFRIAPQDPSSRLGSCDYSPRTHYSPSESPVEKGLWASQLAINLDDPVVGMDRSDLYQLSGWVEEILKRSMQAVQMVRGGRDVVAPVFLRLGTPRSKAKKPIPNRWAF